MNTTRVVVTLVGLSIATGSAGAQSQPVGWTYTMNMIVDSGGVAHRSSTAMRYSIVPGKVRMEFVQVSNSALGADIEGTYQVMNAADSTMLTVMPSQHTATILSAGIMAKMKTPRTKFETHMAQSRVEDLGAGERIAGHATRHVRLTEQGTMDMILSGEHCTAPINSTTDMWIAPDVDITQAMSSSMSVFATIVGRDGLPVSSSPRADLPAGTALRSIGQTYRPNAEGQLKPVTMTMELRELVHGPLDPALFEPPAGIKVMDMRAMMKDVPQAAMDEAAARVASETSESSKTVCKSLGGTP